MERQEKINPELEHLLRAYLTYNESKNPHHIYKYLQNLCGVYEDIHPYLIRTFNEDKKITATRMEFWLPEWLEEPMITLAQVLDIKIIRTKAIEGNNIEPTTVFVLIGKKTHKQVFHILLQALITLYDNLIDSWREKIAKYNRYVTYHGNKSPWLFKYKPLDGLFVIHSNRRHIRLRVIICFYELMQLRYALDALFIKSSAYRNFKYDVNTQIVEILGPRWRDIEKETKTVKFYFGKKYFKVQNRWLNSKRLPTYWNRLTELRNALPHCKKIQIPKELPPMPRHSRKVKGAAERWKPKSYR